MSKVHIFLIVLTFVGLFGLFSLSTGQESQGISSVTKEAEEPMAVIEKAADLIIKERLIADIGQMLVIGFDGTEFTPELAAIFSELRPGGVLLLKRNMIDEEQTRALIGNIQEASMALTGQPLFVAIDQEGEPINRIQWVKETTGQAELENFTNAYDVGRERAQALLSLGVNMNLAPVLDSGSPDDFLFSRSFQIFQEDASTIVKGLTWGHKKEGVMTVPKHYPGYDGISSNPEIDTIPVVSSFPDTTLFDLVYQDTNQRFIMLSHVIYEDVDPVNPFPFSAEGINILKEQFSSDILIMGDDLLTRAFVAEYELSEIGARSVSSGVDILIAAGYPDTKIIQGFYDGLLTLAENDSNLQIRIRESARKIREVKKEILF